MRLEINQTSAQLGLRRIPQKVSVEQKPADVELEQLSGKLKIESKPVKVEIDQTQALADLNSRHYKIYGKHIAREGTNTALQSIARYAKEGDQLAAIEKGGKPLISQAVKHAYGDKKELKFKWKRGPEIKVKSGRQNIKFDIKDLDGIKFNSKSNWPKVNFEWGKIEAYQKQPPNLEIKAVDERV